MGNPIPADQLALLGDVQLEHVRNLMAKGKKALERHKDHPGKVTAKSALAWLATRRGFVPSRW